MITMTQMYWMTRLDRLCGMLVLGFFVSMLTALVLAVIGGILRAEHNTDDASWKTGRRLHAVMVPICLAISLLFGLLRSLTPTTAEMAAIVVVPKIVNSEKVQMAGNRLYELAVEWMDELRPKSRRAEAGGKAGK